MSEASQKREIRAKIRGSQEADQDKRRCLILRRMAQVLSRSNEEVVVLEIRDSKKPLFTVVARNSIHANDEEQERVEPIQQTLLDNAAKKLENCSGIEAITTVVQLIQRCRSGKDSSILSDRIPFPMHVKIFDALLHNDRQQDINGKKFLERAFGVYVMLISYKNHTHRYESIMFGQRFAEFLTREPPNPPHLASFSIPFEKVANRSTIVLQYLKDEVNKHSEDKILHTSIQNLVEGVNDSMTRLDGDNVIKLDSKVLVNGVHRMLAHFLSKYLDKIQNLKKFPSDPDNLYQVQAAAITFMALHDAYHKLTEFVARMWDFLKSYFRLIDSDSTVNSSLSTIPNVGSADCPETVNENPLTVDDITEIINSSKETTLQSQTTDVNERKDELVLSKQNTWGTYAWTWLQQTVQQGQAATWLWGQRNTYPWAICVLDGN